MDVSLLRQLCFAHSTPGDENEVFDILSNSWKEKNLEVERFGSYAIAAHGKLTGKPKLLICAHADSPGFNVAMTECLEPETTTYGIVTLGGITLEKKCRGQLKTSNGKFEVEIEPSGVMDRYSPHFITVPKEINVQKGDRVTWLPQFEVSADGMINATFLDNRIGCDLIAREAVILLKLADEFDVILAATAMEEVNGFGASVLAENIKPDAVMALDVTYEDKKRDVVMGHGPVVTLSDASILLSMKSRDELQKTVQDAGLKLQTEVYNFSGTDAKAFPGNGLKCPVLPILIATTGNHGPNECVSMFDLEAWLPMLKAVAKFFVKNV